MEYQTILVKKEEGIATVTFNRPRRRNAMNEQMAQELIDALEKLGQDDGVRVVVLTGAGEAFCAGADLSRGDEKEQVLEETNPETIRRVQMWTVKASRLLHTMEKPTIAMVNGPAVGQGMDWALACDIRIGSEKARFRSYCHMGIFPEEGAYFMPRAMGYAKAAELFFTADFWSGQQAKEGGLLNRLVPQEDLERETMEMARKIAKNPPLAIRIAKFLLRKGAEMDFDTVANITAMGLPTVMISEDMKEALTAFREKRQPVFKGK